MKFFLLLTLAVSSVICNYLDEALECTADVCSQQNGCYCATTSPPIDNPPQFVVITTDDAITEYTYVRFFEPMLFDRTNPDGNPISGTFFVPHEYTDYELIHDLYVKGYEIGLNSISKNALSSYWAEADLDTLILEFGGERDLVSYFANIPKEDIIGARTPNFQLRGNLTFEAYAQSGLKYDNSWPTLSNRLLFPYTLDYMSTQQCSIGICPNASFPGFWVAPIVNLQGQDGEDCSVIFGCSVNGTEEVIYDWLVGEFESTYEDNRAPLTLSVNAAWFQYTEGALEAFEMFLDYLETLDDVFVTSFSNVLQYMENPVNASDYSTVVPERDTNCVPRTCALDFTETEIRYMKSCVTCPAVYPWLGNPLGEST